MRVHVNPNLYELRTCFLIQLILTTSLMVFENLFAKMMFDNLCSLMVLKAMSMALEVTELAYLDMTDKVMDQYPELVLMGSCLLVLLMRDEDVYVMNLGDSRDIVAQHDQNEEAGSSQTGDNGTVFEGVGNEYIDAERVVPDQDVKLTALQLSTHHSTSIEEATLAR